MLLHVGRYSVDGSCDPSLCCCFRSATIAQSSSASGSTIMDLSLSGPVTGRCGGHALATFALGVPSSDSLSYSSYSYHSDQWEQHAITRNPSTGAINDVNLELSRCNAVLTSVSQNSAAAHSASALVVLALAALAAIVMQLQA